MARLPLLLGLLVCSPAFAGDGFEAENTWSVVAGVLRWQDKSLAAFSDRHRKDKELDTVLAERGVPAGQRTLLLDGEATTGAIKKALEKTIARVSPAGTLIFYFAGHGLKPPKTGVIFASADVRTADAAATGLVLSDLPQLFVGKFRGKRVVLLADCCYSGGLGEVARALHDGGIDALSLTSAEASNVSTGNWTFSQSLIDVLRGRALCDLDGDGRLGLAELAAEVHAGMKNREAQRHGYHNYGVPESWQLASVTSPETLAPGSGELSRNHWVRVESNAVARVLGVKNGKLRLSLYDYSDESQRWADASEVRPLTFKTYPVGARIDVTWKGQTYEAAVVIVDDDFHFITYPGFSHEWDEWVTSTRIVGPHADQASQRPVQVEWHGQWWDAVVTGERAGKTCIHYIGYDASWDECVGKSRLRAP